MRWISLGSGSISIRSHKFTRSMPANLDPGTGQHRPIRDQVPSAILSCGDMAYNSPTVVNKATKRKGATCSGVSRPSLLTMNLMPATFLIYKEAKRPKTQASCLTEGEGATCRKMQSATGLCERNSGKLLLSLDFLIKQHLTCHTGETLDCKRDPRRSSAHVA